MTESTAPVHGGWIILGFLLLMAISGSACVFPDESSAGQYFGGLWLALFSISSLLFAFWLLLNLWFSVRDLWLDRRRRLCNRWFCPGCGNRFAFRRGKFFGIAPHNKGMPTIDFEGEAFIPFILLSCEICRHGNIYDSIGSRQYEQGIPIDPNWALMPEEESADRGEITGFPRDQ